MKIKATGTCLVAAVAILLACGSDDSPTDSDHDDPVDDALASATIGPSGGELIHMDFILTVPQGAFQSNATLSLYLSDSSHPMDQQSLTSVYRLTGLPESFEQPLNVRIRYTDTLVGCGYVVVGGDVENPATGQTQSAVRMLEASGISGFLSAVIPPGGQAASSAARVADQTSTLNDALPVYLVGTAGYEPPLDTAEFRFILPRDLNANARSYLPYDFCRGIDSLEAVGFSFDRVPKPIEVYVYFFATPDAPEFCLFLPSWGRFCLSFDRRALEDWYNTRDAVRYASIRECVHCAACTYDDSYFNLLLLKKAIFNPERYWFHQAVACCLEEKLAWFDPNMTFQPVEFNENVHEEKKAVFSGLQVPAGCTIVDSRHHGTGLSPLIKHLTNNFGDGVIFSLYHRIDANDPPITALRNLFSEGVNVWFPAFMKEYVRGNVYGGPFGGLPLYESDASGAFTIAAPGDTLHSFTNSYRDISARVYVIDMEYASIDTITLSISSSNASADNLHLLVFGHKDATTDPFLTEAAQEVTIPDALVLKAEGYTQLWAVVVNSAYTAPDYNGTCDVTLQVRAALREGLPFNRCLPWFDLYCYFTQVIGGTPPDTSQFDNPFWPNWEAVRGSFSGLTFTAVWDTVDYYNNAYSGNMDILLDPTYDTVLSFEVNASIRRNIQQTETISISGFNLPVTESTTHTRRFKVSGAAACSRIIEIADTLFTDEPSMIKTLDSIKCVTDSYVEVYFYEHLD